MLGTPRGELSRLASECGLDEVPEIFASFAEPGDLLDVASRGAVLGELSVATAGLGHPEQPGVAAAEVRRQIQLEAAAFNLAVALFDCVVDEVPYYIDSLSTALGPVALRRRLLCPDDPAAALAGDEHLQAVIRLFDFVLVSAGLRLRHDGARLEELAALLLAMYESELELSSDRLAAKRLPIVFIGALAIPSQQLKGRALFEHLSLFIQLWDDWRDLKADMLRLAPNGFLDADPAPRFFPRLVYLGRCLARIFGRAEAQRMEIVDLLGSALGQALAAAQQLDERTYRNTVGLFRSIMEVHAGPLGGYASAAWKRHSSWLAPTGRRVDFLSELSFRVRNPRRRPLRSARLSAQLVDEAVARALSFLEGHQEPNGRLRGFLLHPGASTHWITAHVAWVLEEVPEAEPLCRRAGEYLEDRGRERAGWGYNARVAVDNDSSAQAAMVLHRFGVRVTEEWLSELCDSRCEGGGFSTYRVGPGRRGTMGWQAAHPDVTCAVVSMLGRIGGWEDVIGRAQHWLREQLVDGALPSYWWRGFPYGLWVQARAGLEPELAAVQAKQLLPGVQSCPDLPLLLVATMTGGTIDELDTPAVEVLVSGQRSDGSWSCEPCLRVTHQDHHSSGTNAPGRLYADRRRVYSTAHAIEALHMARRLL